MGYNSISDPLVNPIGLNSALFHIFCLKNFILSALRHELPFYHPRVNFSWQPLRTFHYLYQTLRKCSSLLRNKLFKLSFKPFKSIQTNLWTGSLKLVYFKLFCITLGFTFEVQSKGTSQTSINARTGFVNKVDVSSNSWVLVRNMAPLKNSQGNVSLMDKEKTM